MVLWSVMAFSELSTHQLYDIMKLRVDVFVVEQNCPYGELDNKDTLEGAYHLLGKNEETNELVAYSRLLPTGVSYDEVSIVRVTTRLTARKNGLGHELIKQAISACQSRWPKQSIKIGAQEHLSGFYQKHGFKTVSESYLEDGIPHIHMLLDLQ